MSRVFFISDLHIYHKKLCERYRDGDVDDDYKKIVSEWNSVVTKRDKVYVLGDITMEKDEYIEQFIKDTNGHKVIIGGNHDTEPCCKKLHELGVIVMGCLKYKGFIVTHIPIHPSECELFRGNIHGHVHNKSIDYGDRYFNVALDVIGYKPILFDDIVKSIQKRRGAI